jgi:hypothetical protein
LRLGCLCLASGWSPVQGVLPSVSKKKNWSGPQRTHFLLLRVRWNVYTESLPSNGSIRHDIIVYVSVLHHSQLTFVCQDEIQYTYSSICITFPW